MRADNDNLHGCVEGIDDWIPLYEAAREMVERVAERRNTTPSKAAHPGDKGAGQTDLKDCGRGHQSDLTGAVRFK